MLEDATRFKRTYSRHEKSRHLKSLEVDWNRLYESNPHLSPYQSYSFNLAVRSVTRLSPRRYNLTPVFFVFYGLQGEARLIAPLYVRKARNGTKVYLFTDFMPAGYSDLIYSPDLTQQEFDVALSVIATELGNPMFLFRKVNQQSLLNQFLRCSNYDMHDIGRQTCVEIPRMSSYGKYWESLSKSTRQSIRTSINRLEREGYAWEVKLIQGEPLSSSTMRTLMDIYFKRYSQRGYRGLRSRLLAFSKRYLNPVTRALQHSDESFCAILEIEGTPAAFCAGFERQGGRLVIPFLSIDCDWGRYSPGGLLITEIMEWLHEQKMHSSLDLSRGGEKYKYRYGGKDHFNYNYEFRIRKETRR